jgi:hypothetical protein
MVLPVSEHRADAGNEVQGCRSPWAAGALYAGALLEMHRPQSRARWYGQPTTLVQVERTRPVNGRQGAGFPGGRSAVGPQRSYSPRFRSFSVHTRFNCQRAIQVGAIASAGVESHSYQSRTMVPRISNRDSTTGLNKAYKYISTYSPCLQYISI